jgi:hypothetical protein
VILLIYIMTAKYRAVLASAIEMVVMPSSTPPSAFDRPIEPEPLPLEPEAVPDVQAVQSTTDRPKTNIEVDPSLGGVSTSNWPYGNEWVFQNVLPVASL